MEEGSDELTPPDIKELASKALDNLVPRKTKETYFKAYQRFQNWLKDKGTTKVSESTLLAYFQENLAVKAPTTMWSEYSLLKKMLRVQNGVDISKFTSITDLLKQTSRSHQKKKASTFSNDEVDRFLSSAPNTLDFIQEKLAFLLGIFGGLRSEEFCEIQFASIEEFDDHLKVCLAQRKTDQAGNGTTFFVMACEVEMKSPLYYFRLYKEAFDKTEGYLFRQIKNGKITKQKRGKSFFYDLPKRVATFLKLENPEAYTGHAIRRTATTWLAERGASTNIIQKFGGWKSASVAQEYIDDSDMMRKTIAEKFQNKTSSASKPKEITESMKMSGITFHAEKIIIENIWNSGNNENK
jgi:integrase